MSGVATSVLAAAALFVIVGESPAQTGVCLDSAKARGWIEEKRAFSPNAALDVARRLFPSDEVLRARLCIANERHVYVVTALRRDGKVVRVILDALTGRPVPQR